MLTVVEIEVEVEVEMNGMALALALALALSERRGHEWIETDTMFERTATNGAICYVGCMSILGGLDCFSSAFVDDECEC